MGAFSLITDSAARVPRVVVVGLASCFGCQLQITNAEAHLTDILGQIDLRYWQLVTSEDMVGDFDVAIIEGAVTTRESEVLALLLAGKDNRSIATELILSEGTIKTHVHNIMRKTETKNREELRHSFWAN